MPYLSQNKLPLLIVSVSGLSSVFHYLSIHVSVQQLISQASETKSRSAGAWDREPRRREGEMTGGRLLGTMDGGGCSPSQHW